MARLTGERAPWHPASRVFGSNRRVWSFSCCRPAVDATGRVGSKPGEWSSASPPASPGGTVTSVACERSGSCRLAHCGGGDGGGGGGGAGLRWALGCRSKQCGREGRQRARGRSSTRRREDWPQPAVCTERPQSKKSPVTWPRSGTLGVRVASPGLWGRVLVREGRLLLTTGYACTWVFFPASPLNHWQKVKYLSVPVVGAGEK